MAVLALALGLTSTSACRSKPDDEPKRWTLTFDESNAPESARVWLGDHYVGIVSAPENYEIDRKLYYVRGKVPANFTGDDYTGFELEFRTPCGTSRIPLSTVKVEGHADPLMHFDASLVETSSTTTVVWTAMGTASKIQVGEAELSVDMDHFAINGLECAPKHTVTVDGKVMGEFDVTPEALVGVFVPKDTSTCYELTVAYFGEDGGHTDKTIWRGKAAYPFPHARVDYLLKPVPTLLEVNKGVGGARRVGVNEISCDTKGSG